LHHNVRYRGSAENVFEGLSRSQGDRIGDPRTIAHFDNVGPIGDVDSVCRLTPNTSLWDGITKEFTCEVRFEKLFLVEEIHVHDGQIRHGTGYHVLHRFAYSAGPAVEVVVLVENFVPHGRRAPGA